MASGSTKAVYAAIAGNSVVMVAKFAAFAVSGSGAMLSEGIHSMADVGNQSLLALGIARSKKQADADHPYGYALDQFIWALISAVGIFFLGCGVTLYHGVHSLLHPAEVEQIGLALGVLLFSGIVEGWTLYVAAQAVREAANKLGVSFRDYIVDGPDPMSVAVLMEDGAAVLGICIAAAALGLIQVTGNPIWDGVGSIIISLLLGSIAIFLIYKNREALLGQSVTDVERQRIVDVLRADPVVDHITDVKATLLGADSMRFKAEIDFDGRAIAKRHLESLDLQTIFDGIRTRDDLERFLVDYGDQITDALGDEVDRLERVIREAVPRVQHVDLEAD